MSPQHPALTSSFLNNLFLTFVSPLLRQGEAIQLSTLWPLHPDDSSQSLTESLQLFWDAEVFAAAASNRPPSLVSAWARCFLPSFLGVGLCTWLKTLCSLLQTRVVMLLLGVVADPLADVWTGTWYALLIGVLGVIGATSDAWYWRQTWFHGNRWRLAVVGLLHKKASRISSAALSAVSTGHVVSLATNDAERLLALVHHLPHVVLVWVDILIFTYFLYSDLGVAAFAGLGLMAAISLTQLAVYSRLYGLLRRDRADTTDARLNLTAQSLSGIRAIKMNSWERSVLGEARVLRAREVKELKSQYKVRSTFEGLIHSKYILLTGAIILTLWFLGEPITPQRVYSATTLMYLLEMDRVWRAVENAELWSDAGVSFQRFAHFLLLPEVVVPGEGGGGKEKKSEMEEEVGEKGEKSSGAEAAGEGQVVVVVDTARGASKGAAEAAAVGGEKEEEEVATLLGGSEARSVRVSPASHLQLIPSSPTPTPREDLACFLQGVNAGWGVDPTTSPLALSGLTLTIPRHALTALVGPIGSGKSTVLSLLLGELRVYSGLCSAPQGLVSYAPQQAFIFSGTVLENITLGGAVDLGRVAAVLEAVDLTQEVGVGTVLGEKGVSLSGGQRARLGLARALYRRADTYLLDDPFSALDSVVGQRVFTRAIETYLRGKTVLLATHQLHFLRVAHSVCVLPTGLQGSFEDLEGALKGEQGAATRAALGDALTAAILREGSSGGDKPGQSPTTITTSTTATRTDIIAPPTPTPTEGLEVFHEEGGSGAVGAGVYATYAAFWRKASTLSDTLVIAFVLLAAAALFPIVGAYLGRWSAQPLSQQQSGGYTTAAVYTALLLGAVGFATLRPVVFTMKTVSAGHALHDAVFQRVLAAPLAFFDSRPMGSILSRFSRDVQVLDEKLPLVACDVALQVGRALGVLGLVVVGNPGMLLLLPPLFYAFHVIRSRFIATSRAIKRLDSATRPPTLSLLTEFLGALPTLRAFHAVPYFTALYYSALDANTQAWTSFMYVTRWLALRLDLLCVCFLTTASAAAVVSSRAGVWGAGNVSSGATAMALAYCSMLLGELDWMLRQSVELENCLLSVERLLEYSTLRVEELGLEEEEGEGEEEGGGKGRGAKSGSMIKGGRGEEEENAPLTLLPPHPSSTTTSSSLPWPNAGGMEFKGVWLKYPRGYSTAPALPTPLPPSSPSSSPSPSSSGSGGAPEVFALKGVTLSIPPGAKVGVCGRTGAGKSTLFAAVLRLVEPEVNGSGECGISVDGVDVATLPLPTLRKAFSVIPQEPILYQGTLRANLDPYLHRSDAEVLGALESVGMRDRGLEWGVEEGGANLSVGERQLVCLARALVRKPKLLLVDECTANVDRDTDEKIQHTIKTLFHQSTIITVAHRLQTVLDTSDLVVVMGEGVVVECGPPQDLLTNNPQGPFASLVRAAGL